MFLRAQELKYDYVVTGHYAQIEYDESAGRYLLKKAKVRYRRTEKPATIIQTGDYSITAEFNEPQRAITKGQAVVLYDGDIVPGGGTTQ